MTFFDLPLGWVDVADGPGCVTSDADAVLLVSGWRSESDPELEAGTPRTLVSEQLTGVRAETEVISLAF